MTTARDTITETMDVHRWGSMMSCHCGAPIDEDMPYISHRAHVIDELVNALAPQRITAVEELDELPVGSVVRSANGVWQKDPDDDGINPWTAPGSQRLYAARWVMLPAEVLALGSEG